MIQAVKDKRARRHHNNRLPVGPNGGVQLLLVQTIDSLGKVGEVVEVKTGYAKNYLIPQGLATIATDHHRRMVEKRKAQLEEIKRQKIADYKKLADQIGAKTVTIEATANDEGHLYGSVSQEEVGAALKAENLVITPDQVRFEGPLKETGLYNVRIYLGEEIDSILKVWVIQKTTKE